ncbi:MAG: cache domain-containing protein [Bacteroidetes bacterium]|nr:cache domain-containing protein [Bacteroidota bacterium]
MRNIKIISRVCIVFFFITMFQSCKKDTPVTDEKIIETALDEFVASLQSKPPTTADISDRVLTYMRKRSVLFYGSTVTLLDSTGKALISPYWFVQNGVLVSSSNLMDTSYNINSQLWLRHPIDRGVSIWTEPYFDAGGGNIWMKTRAVPVYIDGKIKAVATTDMSIN